MPKSRQQYIDDAISLGIDGSEAADMADSLGLSDSAAEDEVQAVVAPEPAEVPEFRMDDDVINQSVSEMAGELEKFYTVGSDGKLKRNEYRTPKPDDTLVVNKLERAKNDLRDAIALRYMEGAEGDGGMTFEVASALAEDDVSEQLGKVFPVSRADEDTLEINDDPIQFLIKPRSISFSAPTLPDELANDPMAMEVNWEMMRPGETQQEYKLRIRREAEHRIRVGGADLEAGVISEEDAKRAGIDEHLVPSNPVSEALSGVSSALNLASPGNMAIRQLYATFTGDDSYDVDVIGDLLNVANTAGDVVDSYQTGLVSKDSAKGNPFDVAGTALRIGAWATEGVSDDFKETAKAVAEQAEVDEEDYRDSAEMALRQLSVNDLAGASKFIVPEGEGPDSSAKSFPHMTVDELEALAAIDESNEIYSDVNLAKVFALYRKGDLEAAQDAFDSVPFSAMPKSVAELAAPDVDSFINASKGYDSFRKKTGGDSADRLQARLAAAVTSREVVDGQPVYVQNALGTTMGGLGILADAIWEADVKQKDVLPALALASAVAGVVPEGAKPDFVKAGEAVLDDLKLPTAQGLRSMAASDTIGSFMKANLGFGNGYEVFDPDSEYVSRILANRYSGLQGPSSTLPEAYLAAGGSADDTAYTLTKIASIAGEFVGAEDVLLGGASTAATGAAQAVKAASAVTGEGLAPSARLATRFKFAADGFTSSVAPALWRAKTGTDSDLSAVVSRAANNAFVDMFNRGVDGLSLYDEATQAKVLNLISGAADPEAAMSAYKAQLADNAAKHAFSTMSLLKNGTPEARAIRAMPEYGRVSSELDALVSAGRLPESRKPVLMAILEQEAFASGDPAGYFGLLKYSLESAPPPSATAPPAASVPPSSPPVDGTSATVAVPRPAAGPSAAGGTLVPEPAGMTLIPEAEAPADPAPIAQAPAPAKPGAVIVASPRKRAKLAIDKIGHFGVDNVGKESVDEVARAIADLQSSVVKIESKLAQAEALKSINAAGRAAASLKEAVWKGDASAAVYRGQLLDEAIAEAERAISSTGDVTFDASDFRGELTSRAVSAASSVRQAVVQPGLVELVGPKVESALVGPAESAPVWRHSGASDGAGEAVVSRADDSVHASEAGQIADSVAESTGSDAVAIVVGDSTKTFDTYVDLFGVERAPTARFRLPDDIAMSDEIRQRVSAINESGGMAVLEPESGTLTVVHNPEGMAPAKHAEVVTGLAESIRAMSSDIAAAKAKRMGLDAERAAAAVTAEPTLTRDSVTRGGDSGRQYLGKQQGPAAVGVDIRAWIDARRAAGERVTVDDWVNAGGAPAAYRAEARRAAGRALGTGKETAAKAVEPEEPVQPRYTNFIEPSEAREAPPSRGSVVDEFGPDKADYAGGTPSEASRLEAVDRILNRLEAQAAAKGEATPSSSAPDKTGIMEAPRPKDSGKATDSQTPKAEQEAVSRPAEEEPKPAAEKSADAPAQAPERKTVTVYKYTGSKPKKPRGMAQVDTPHGLRQEAARQHNIVRAFDVAAGNSKPGRQAYGVMNLTPDRVEYIKRTVGDVIGQEAVDTLDAASKKLQSGGFADFIGSGPVEIMRIKDALISSADALMDMARRYDEGDVGVAWYGNSKAELARLAYNVKMAIGTTGKSLEDLAAAVGATTEQVAKVLEDLEKKGKIEKSEGQLNFEFGGEVLGTFEVKDAVSHIELKAKTASAVERFFFTGDFDVLLHEGGHFVADILQARGWTDAQKNVLAKHFDVDAAGDLTAKGSEQFAEAYRYWRTSGIAKSTMLGYAFFELKDAVSRVYATVRGSKPFLASVNPEVLAMLDAQLRPDKLVSGKAVSLSSRAPGEMFDVQTGKANSPGVLPADLFKTIGAKPGDKVDVGRLFGGAVASIVGERARSGNIGEVVQVSPHLVVPKDRWPRMQRQLKTELAMHSLDRASMVVNKEGVIFLDTPDKVIGFKNFFNTATEGADPALLPVDLVNRMKAGDYSKVHSDEWNRLVELYYSKIAGPNTSRTANGLAASPTVIHSILRTISGSAGDIAPDSTKAIYNAFFGEDPASVSPAAQAIIRRGLIEMSLVGSEFKALAKAMWDKDPRATYVDIARAFRSQTTPNVNVAAVRSVESAERALMNSASEGISDADIDSIDRLLGPSASSRERAAIAVLANASPGMRKTRGKGNKALADAIGIIRDGISRQRNFAVDRGKTLIAGALGEAGKHWFSMIGDEAAEKACLEAYHRFYNPESGDAITSLLDYLDGELASISTNEFKGKKINRRLSAVSLVTRLRASEVIDKIVREMVEERVAKIVKAPNPSITSSEYASRVINYANKIIIDRVDEAASKSSQVQSASPILTGIDKLAYKEAAAIVSSHGIKVGDWTLQRVYVDGNPVLLPDAIVGEMKAIIGRTMGYDNSLMSGKIASEKLLISDTRLAEIAHSLWGAIQAKNPFTLANIKIGQTMGWFILRPQHMVGNFLGSVGQVFMGAGAKDAFSVTLRAPYEIAAGIAARADRGGRIGSGPGPGVMVANMSEPTAAGEITAALFGERGPSLPGRFTSTPVITDDGRVYPVHELYNMSLQHGLHGSFIKAETVDAIDMDLAKHEPIFSSWVRNEKLGKALRFAETDINPVGAARWLQEVITETVTANDNYFRIGLFIERLKAGDTPENAAAVAKRAMFNYSDLTEFERRTMRKLIMYYSWLRKSNDLFWYTLVTNPSRVIGQLRATGGIHDSFAGEDSELTLAEWQKTRVGVFYRNASLSAENGLDSTDPDDMKLMFLAPPVGAPDTVAFMASIINGVGEVVSAGSSEYDYEGRMPASFLSSATPYIQLGAVLYGVDPGTGGKIEYASRNRIPRYYMDLDESLFGGKLAKLYGARPQDAYYPDSSSSLDAKEYVATGTGGTTAWWMAREMFQVVPVFGGSSITTMETLDRSNVGITEAVAAAAAYAAGREYIDMTQPRVGYGEPGQFSAAEVMTLFGFPAYKVASPEQALQRNREKLERSLSGEAKDIRNDLMSENLEDRPSPVQKDVAN
jgi:hypothetical protein